MATSNPNADVYANKLAIMQVLGGLAANPLLFADDRYKQLSVNDFPAELYRDIYSAISSIALGTGEISVKRIDPIDVDQWLRNYPTQYKIFVDNNGADWLNRAMGMYATNTTKFPYYFRELKKCSLLNALRQSGMDTRDLLDQTETNPDRIAKQQAKFDSMDIKDILDHEETKLIKLKNSYGSSNDITEAQAGEGVDELIDDLQKAPDVGVDFVSPLMTTIFRGQRLGTFLMESSAQGIGKSRKQTSEAAHLAVPEYWDNATNTWVTTGYHCPVLHISTELTRQEVQKMWLANIAGVNEDHLNWANATPEEWERIKHAGALLKKAPMYYVGIADYDVEDILNLIKKYVLTKGVMYVYYDYLSSTVKILAETAKETKMSGLREDQILAQFGTKLKDLAKVLNIFIYTATQISGNWKEIKDPGNELIRGAKALSDKTDGSWIMLPVRESDKPIIEAYQQNKQFIDVPTHVMFIFKNRDGSYNNVRLYGHFYRETCRWVDCFMTDHEGNILNVTPSKVRVNPNLAPVEPEPIADKLPMPKVTTSVEESKKEEPVDESWGDTDPLVDVSDPDIFEDGSDANDPDDNDDSVPDLGDSW